MNLLPCFACWFLDDVVARGCSPFECQSLTSYLEIEIERMAKHAEEITPCISLGNSPVLANLENMTEYPKKCPRCGSRKTVKQGFYRHSNKVTQRYHCQTCHKHFRENYARRMKSPSAISNYVEILNLKDLQNYSSRAIANQIRDKFGVVISHVTISRWLRKRD